MRIRKGYWVSYRELSWDIREPNERFRDAMVLGHGWHKGRRIVYLHTEEWIYRDDVVKVFGQEVSGGN